MPVFMTLEEMAAKLRTEGWRVEPPIDPAICKHERKHGTGAVASDGASFLAWYCLDCNARFEQRTPAHNPHSSMHLLSI